MLYSKRNKFSAMQWISEVDNLCGFRVIIQKLRWASEALSLSSQYAEKIE